MSDDRGTLEAVAEHLVLAVSPLRAAVADVESFRVFMHRLGWNVDALPPAYTDLAARVDAAVSALDALADEPEISEVVAVVERVGDVYRAVDAIAAAPPGVDGPTFLAEIGERLVEVLLVDYLAAALPKLSSALEMTGVIEHELHRESEPRPAFLRSRLRYEEIPRILSEPTSLPARVYGWGTPEFNARRVLAHLLDFFTAARVPARLLRVDRALRAGLQPLPPDAVERLLDRQLQVPIFQGEVADVGVEAGIAVLELPAEDGEPPGLIVQPYVPPGLGEEIEIADDLRLVLRAGTDVASTFGIVLRPGEIGVRYPFQPGGALPSAGFSARLVWSPGEGTMLFGQPGRSGLRTEGAELGLSLDYVAGQLELRISLATRGLALVVSPADLDGFMGELLGGEGIEIPAPFDVAWSNRTGLSFAAGVGFQISLYPHLELGPIAIQRVDLGLVAGFAESEPPNVALEAATSLSGAIGPVAFAADAMGIRLELVFEEGNAGPFDVDFGFKPPTGLGIVVDAGPVAGGGFLAFDHANGRYAGILQLEIFEIAVTAIGLLDTRLPDGQPGFSFLIIIAAELPPIQLGYGFTLNGVGGLAGINRTIVTEALQSGLRTGSVDHILFPADPIANAPQLISDLRAIFPPRRGRYVFGPMAILGWGTPTLIEAEIGIILELPEPILLVLLGQVRMALPAKEAAIVFVQIDVLGILSFEKKLLSVDATLRNSNVAGFPLTGDMAMRFSWGEQPNLALAMGGLNPHFQPPPGFPALNRLTIALGMGDNPRLTLQAYVALTANSRQFGASAELYAAAGSFNIYGFVGFDALIVFSPFSFRADLSARLALRRGTNRIAGVSVDATLTGPSPFHAWGKGCISILFLDICVPFDRTFGVELPFELLARAPWLLLRAALEDARNWSATLPPAVHAAVAVREPQNGAAVLVHPMGVAAVRQKVVPLNRKLEKFGEFEPSDADRFDVTGVRVGDDPGAGYDVVKDFFAPGEFEELTDSQKISRASFERMDAGISVGSDRVQQGADVNARVVYETRIVDVPWESRPGPVFRPPRDLQLALEGWSAAAFSPLKTTGPSKFAPAADRDRAFGLVDQEFVIASAGDLTARGDLGRPTTEGEAHRVLAEYLARHPEETEALQVVPAHESVRRP